MLGCVFVVWLSVIIQKVVAPSQRPYEPVNDQKQSAEGVEDSRPDRKWPEKI
jgi:hypothetical protein